MYLGNRNPWTDRYKILHAGCYLGHNHASQFLWRSVKGFWCGEGSNFGIFHWLASSPLKHSRTTVRVCDQSLKDMEPCHKFPVMEKGNRTKRSQNVIENHFWVFCSAVGFSTPLIQRPRHFLYKLWLWTLTALVAAVINVSVWPLWEKESLGFFDS